MLKFTKMHGLGNDFMVIDGVRQKFVPEPSRIRRWADRHTGIGFDQLLVVESDMSADFYYRIFNADGTEVAQCGNGARCIARFIHDQGLSHRKTLRIRTKAGILMVYVDKEITVNMGVPVIGSMQALETPSGRVHLYPLTLGNPHGVMEVADVAKAPVHAWGNYLAAHPRFPEGINVGFMQIEDPTHLRLRVYERGVGETQACGSGACAAAVVGHMLGKTSDSVQVTLAGGTLAVQWQGMGQPVWMRGTAVTVFEGVV